MKKISSNVGLAREFVELLSLAFAIVKLVLELVSSAINYRRADAIL
jgi:hypothetical protein